MSRSSLVPRAGIAAPLVALLAGAALLGSVNTLKQNPLPQVGWNETQGGFRVGVGNLLKDPRSGLSMVPYIDGSLEFDVQRQLKSSSHGKYTRAYRLDITLLNTSGGCCGGEDAKPEVIESIQSDPFVVEPGDWINDVVPIRVPCIPGRYKVRVSIEEFRAKSERRPVDRWVPVARSTYFIKTG